MNAGEMLYTLGIGYALVYSEIFKSWLLKSNPRPWTWRDDVFFAVALVCWPLTIMVGGTIIWIRRNL